MKAPITNHQSPENTQTPGSNPERGGLTPISVAQVGNLLYRRLAIGALGNCSLVIGASLVLGYWCLVLT